MIRLPSTLSAPRQGDGASIDTVTLAPLAHLHAARPPMKRQTRPFAVEIKSSRRPAPKAAPVRTDPLRIAAAAPDLWSNDHRAEDRARNPASLTALDEAHRVFAKLTAPAPVRPQRSDPLQSGTAVAPDEPVRVAADEPEEAPSRTGHRAGRRGSILPDLTTTQALPERAARPREADQRSAPRNQPRPQRTKTSVPLPGGLGRELVSSDHQSTLPSEPAMDAISLSDHPDTGSGPHPAALAVSSSVPAAKPRRSVRWLDQGWAYRAACRKATRRGKPLPLRTAQRRKPR